MKIKKFVYLGLVSVFLWNCSNQSDIKIVKVADALIVQQEDGIVSLELANAGYYNDIVDPSNNTAEWNVKISKPGGYKVWLSSATRDTINLNYSTTVKVNLPDSQLAGIPVCDKIVQNSKDVSYPYFRADSYMGSVYFDEPGEYNIQVISEKALAHTPENQTASVSDDSKLLAVTLSPMTN
jgi:hypothetical protein